jgi:hypothetical protein
MLFKTKKVAIGGTSVDADQHGVAGLKDLVVIADVNARQIRTGVDLPRCSDGVLDDGVDRTQRDGVVEEVGEQFNDAAKGAMADEDQGQDELANPGAGDGEVEQDRLVVVGLGSEGLVKGVVSEGELLVDELAADLVLRGEISDGLPGKGVQGDLVALVGCQKVSRTVRRRCLVAVVGHGYEAQGRDLRRDRGWLAPHSIYAIPAFSPILAHHDGPAPVTLLWTRSISALLPEMCMVFIVVAQARRPRPPQNQGQRQHPRTCTPCPR